jgi:hypothetical protein
VRNLVPAGAFIIMGGPPKFASKSFKALHLAECVSTGRPFLGLATKPRRVIYVVLEDGETRLEMRSHQLGIAPNDPLGVTVCFGRQGLEQAIHWLANTAEPLLVIVDPFVNWLVAMGVKDENASLEIAGFIERFQALARLSGSSIIAIDHYDKSWHGVRGSGAKSGSSDGWLDVRPVGKEGEGLTRIRATLRDGKPVEIGVELTSTPCAPDCPVCKDWDSPEDRVQIRLIERSIDQMPRFWQPNEAQLAGNGTTENAKEARRAEKAEAAAVAKVVRETKASAKTSVSAETDKARIIALLGTPEAIAARLSGTSVADRLNLSQRRVSTLLAQLVDAGDVQLPQGGFGYRLAAAPLVEPAFTPPEPLADVGTPTREETLEFLAGLKMRAVTTVSKRLHVTTGTARELLDRAAAEASAELAANVAATVAEVSRAELSPISAEAIAAAIAANVAEDAAEPEPSPAPVRARRWGAK